MFNFHLNSHKSYKNGNINLFFRCSRYFRPKSPCESPSASDVVEDDLKSGSICLTVESLTDCESTTLELDLGELFPDLEISSSGPAPNAVVDLPSDTGSSRFWLDPTVAVTERIQPTPPVVTQNGPTSHNDCKCISNLY